MSGKIHVNVKENNTFEMIGNTISKLPLNCGITKLIQQSIVKIPIRHGYRLRGKPFGVANSLEERLKCKYSYFEVMLHNFFHSIKSNLISLN